MKSPMREILQGLAGGVGFSVGLVVLDMPWWLSALVAVGLYLATALALPPTALTPPDWVALGVSAADRDRFVAGCRAGAFELGRIAGQLEAHPFRSQVSSLARTIDGLAAFLEQKPEGIPIAHAVPQNLEQLLRLLRHYMQLRAHPSSDAVGTEALSRVEKTVGNAALAFEGMHRQLLNDDLAALKASAESLEFLLGIDVELERERRRRELDQLLAATQTQNGPGSTRPRANERSS